MRWQAVNINLKVNRVWAVIASAFICVVLFTCQAPPAFLAMAPSIYAFASAITVSIAHRYLIFAGAFWFVSLVASANSRLGWIMYVVETHTIAVARFLAF